MKKSRTRKKIKRSSKKDGVKVEYIENGEQLETILRDDVKDGTLTAKILEIVYKIIGKRVPIRKTNDGYMLSYLIISFLLTYVVHEIYRHSSTANTDVLLTGVFSINEFANVLPKVLSRSIKMQSELVKCMSKKSIYSSIRYSMGYSSEIPIDVESEITDVINTQVTFAKKEIKDMIYLIPKNLGVDFNIDDYINIDIESMKRKLFGKIENSDSLIIYNENNLPNEYSHSKYKNLRETCPDFLNPINEMIFQELSVAVNSIKSRINNEIIIHKMTATNKINEISYLSMISITTVILCIIVFSKTFVIQKIAKCFKKPKTISRKPQKLQMSPRRSNRLIEKSNRLSPRRSQLIERKKSSSPY
jgi:hypothetical protein